MKKKRIPKNACEKCGSTAIEDIPDTNILLCQACGNTQVVKDK